VLYVLLKLLEDAFQIEAGSVVVVELCSLLSGAVVPVLTVYKECVNDIIIVLSTIGTYSVLLDTDIHVTRIMVNLHTQGEQSHTSHLSEQ
jgi:hypothetical protein